MSLVGHYAQSPGIDCHRVARVDGQRRDETSDEAGVDILPVGASF